MIYDINCEIGREHLMIDPIDHTRRKSVSSTSSNFEDLLVPVFKGGDFIYDEPDIHTIRQSVKDEMRQLDKSIKRFVNPHNYSVGLEKSLFECKTELILNLRDQT